MQSRRHEDRMIPPDPKLKLRDRRIELGHAHGHDPFAMMPRRDLLDHPPRPRRSLSPRRLEGSRAPRLLGGDGRSGSVERRDYDRDFGGGGGGGRDERVRSRSPTFGAVRERSRYDDGFSRRDLPDPELRRRYEFVDCVDLDDEVNAGSKPENRHHAARLGREKDFDSGRSSRTSRYGMLGQKVMASEENAVRDLFRLSKDLGAVSKYGEGGGGFSSSLKNRDMGHFKDERARNPDPLLDKFSVMESHRERDKPTFYSRDVSYPQVEESQSKDYIGSSSGISRANFQGSYRDGMPLLMDEYSGKSAKFTEPLGYSGYAQRSSIDSGRDPNMENRDLPHYWRDTFSPTRAERQDYLNPRPRGGDSDIYGYPSDEFYRTMSTREQVEYDHKDLLRPGTRDPLVESIDNTGYTSRNLRDTSFLDHPSVQKQKVSNYLDVGVSTASKGGEYLDSGSAQVEYGRRVSGDREMPHMGVSKDHKISHFRLDYGFGKDAGPASHFERMRNSPEFEYDTKTQRLSGRSFEFQMEEHGMYESSDRTLKRKYNEDAEMSRHNSRSIMSGKWYNDSGVRELDDRNEDWTGQDSSASFSSRNAGYDNRRYQREERKFVGADRHRFSASEDWLPSHDYMEHVEEHSIKPHRSGGKYSKGHLRPGPQSSHNSSRFNGRHGLSNRNNVWIRDQDHIQLDKHENEVDPSEDWMSSAKSEPPEGSEEFKQLVHKAFLIFSKKLNENPGVRKRYKEQGRAGSLFCIVCGRSVSKEFMDTQRLALHAFMSHKFRLRAEHLGLHKAICVLLGWKSVVAPDVTTWVPEHLRDAEAMAQKEDLILWPPLVIIHNSSVEENNVDERTVITLEAVGDFLRGKGFSGGKFRTRLGKASNRSVILVKFSGTFSGLQDAERLHKYFVENKRGRADFERVGSSSSKGKSSGQSEGGAMQEQNNIELVLYGYIGIAEDLDKVDIDTKRKCLIKSKEEIQDIANAPIKPE